MSSQTPYFRRPNPVERIFNKMFGLLIDLGLGLPHNYLLQVRGRKTGRIYSTPINLLELKERRFLVAGRGYTQWVRSAQVAREITLKKGARREHFRLSPIPDEGKPEVLKAYVDCFKLTVQRYFPVPAGSALEAFVPVADRYPVFELIPPDADMHRTASKSARGR
jgi:hypothetical protein